MATVLHWWLLQPPTRTQEHWRKSKLDSQTIPWSQKMRTFFSTSVTAYWSQSTVLTYQLKESWHTVFASSLSSTQREQMKTFHWSRQDQA